MTLYRVGVRGGLGSPNVGIPAGYLVLPDLGPGPGPDPPPYPDQEPPPPPDPEPTQTVRLSLTDTACPGVVGFSIAVNGLLPNTYARVGAFEGLTPLPVPPQSPMTLVGPTGSVVFGTFSGQWTQAAFNSATYLLMVF